MDAKGKSIIVVSFWLIVAGLALLAVAGIISPLGVPEKENPIRLLKPVSGKVGEAMELTLVTDRFDPELRASLSLDASNRHALLTTLNLPGILENVCLDPERGLAYLANSNLGVQVVDISDPRDPRLVGSVDTPGNAWDIRMRDQVLFVAAARGGLQIIDVKDPTAPVVLGQVYLPAPLLRLELHRDTVYATSGFRGLQIIDISNLSAPRHIRAIPEKTGFWGLLANDDRLFISRGRSHVDIYDLKRPHTPVRISSVDVPGKSWEFGLKDHHLLVPTRERGLIAIDVADPAAPATSHAGTPGRDLEALKIVGDMAFATNRGRLLYAYDLTRPGRPVETLQTDLPFTPRNLAVKDGTIYFAASLAGLRAIRIADLSARNPLQTLHVVGVLGDVIIDDPYYYLAVSNYNLLAAARENAGTVPKIVATLPLPRGRVEGMAKSPQHIFIACSEAGLLIFDVSNPRMPRPAGRFNHPGVITDVAQVGRQLYLASITHGFLVVNASYPENLLLLAELDIPEAVLVTVREDRAYVVSKLTGLHVIDISEPASPREIGRGSLPWPLQELARYFELVVAGEKAYLAAGVAELIIFDLGDENNPKISEIIEIEGETTGVQLRDDTLFVTTRQGKLWGLQEEPDGTISKWAVIDTNASTKSLNLQGDTAVLANADAGLTFLPLPQRLDLENGRNSPGRNGRVEVKVRIPPQTTPGFYNLVLFERGQLREFVGVVQVLKKGS